MSQALRLFGSQIPFRHAWFSESEVSGSWCRIDAWLPKESCMATKSRGRISHGHGKEHDCLIDSKSHRTQALCCAVFDYLVHLKASGRKLTTIGSYGESLALLGRRLGKNIPLRNISPTLLNVTVAGLTAIDGLPRKAPFSNDTESSS